MLLLFKIILPTLCSDAVSDWAGWVLAHPHFESSVNSINITSCPPPLRISKPYDTSATYELCIDRKMQLRMMLTICFLDECAAIFLETAYLDYGGSVIKNNVEFCLRHECISEFRAAVQRD